MFPTNYLSKEIYKIILFSINMLSHETQICTYICDHYIQRRCYLFTFWGQRVRQVFPVAIALTQHFSGIINVNKPSTPYVNINENDKKNRVLYIHPLRVCAKSKILGCVSMAACWVITSVDEDGVDKTLRWRLVRFAIEFIAFIFFSDRKKMILYVRVCWSV